MKAMSRGQIVDNELHVYRLFVALQNLLVSTNLSHEISQTTETVGGSNELSAQDR